jgi:hypothetical protein
LASKEIEARKNVPYRLRIESQQSGNLLLLNKGTSGTIYCCCPWLGYATSDLVSAGQPTYIPQEGTAAREQNIHWKYADEGEEELLAILTEQGLNLSWLSGIFRSERPKLKARFLVELLEQIKDQFNGEILHLKVEVK